MSWLASICKRSWWFPTYLPDDVATSCATCDKTAEKMKLCGACRQVLYCNKACQKIDWPKHKTVCIQKKPATIHNTFHALLSSVKSTTPTHSGCEGGRAFVVSNEEGQDKVIAALRRKRGEGEVFIGTSCLGSLDLASVPEKVKYIVVIDVSHITRTFWENVTPIIRESKSKEDCSKEIERDLAKNIDTYFPKSQRHGSQTHQYEQAVSKRLKESISWLSEDRRYQKIRKIFLKNRFVFLSLDFADTRACRAIRTHLDALGLKTHTIYLSNILEFIPSRDLNNYGKSLEILTDKSSFVIDCAEIPYVTTKQLSSLYADTYLELFFNTYRLCGNLPLRCGALQLRERNGAPMQAMYPLIGLQNKCKPEDLFYEYGIQKGYYTQKEIEDVSWRTQLQLGLIAGLTEQDIVQTTMRYAHKMVHKRWSTS